MTRETSDEEKRDTDEVTASLDRGWDLIQKGDLAGAEVAARHVLEVDAESPEGYTLLGAIAAGRGEADEAIDLYDKATQLDPDYVDPLLYLAELYLYPPVGRDANLEEARALCKKALEIADEEDEYLDALLLTAEAEVQAGDLEEATSTLSELPPIDTELPDPQYHLRAGRLLTDVGDLDRAEQQLERALARDPSITDAKHALGLCAEERGEKDKQVRYYLEVRQADLAEPPPAWGVDGARFEALIEEAMAALPDRIRTLLANVPVIAADYPSLELVKDGADPRMLGLFAGLPLPDKSAVGEPPSLDSVHLFQRNIERYARSAGELELEIRRTLLHEAGHFFGLSEDELDAMGLA
jgi:predicted Zn-dependent protease with MMP-like domain/Flp pilus assembly protein TadD